MSQTVDSAQVSAIPPKSNFRLSVITEMGSMLATTSTPNIESFYRQNNIEHDTPLDPFVHLNFGVRYHRLKLLGQTGYGMNYYFPNERLTHVVRRTYASYTGALLGYDVLNDRNQRLYLNVGVGQLRYEYAVIDRTYQQVAFQNLPQFASAGNIPSLKLNNTYWDINLELSQREKRRSSIASVFRLGYRRGWQPARRESGAFQLLDAPSDRISQFYLQGSFYLSRNYPRAAK